MRRGKKESKKFEAYNKTSDRGNCGKSQVFEKDGLLFKIPLVGVHYTLSTLLSVTKSAAGS